MSKNRPGKKKARNTGAVRPAPGSVAAGQPLTVEILPAGGVARRAPEAAAKGQEAGEKSFYGETAAEMLGRVRRELRNIAVLAVVSFGVGLLAVQFIKM